jgi:trimeric autotransporter adhesin
MRKQEAPPVTEPLQARELEWAEDVKRKENFSLDSLTFLKDSYETQGGNMKPIRRLASIVFAYLLFSAGSAAQQSDVDQAPAATSVQAISASVPRLIRYTGTLTDTSGKPLTGTVAVEFAIYQGQNDDVPIWQETQSLPLDGQGRYAVLLGATQPEGLPVELFSAGTARWLGAEAPGAAPQPRVVLVAVPYALKAADADALGGKPASAFVLSQPPAEGPSPQATDVILGRTSSQTAKAPGKADETPLASVGGGGTTNYIPIWTSTTALGNSVLFQTGGQVGMGTTTPGARLDSFSAAISVRGTSSGATGTGVFGNESSTTGVNFGVVGETASGTNGAVGVNGNAKATTGVVYGVSGNADSTTTNAAGVNGYEGATTGLVYGVNGGTKSTTNYAAGVDGHEDATTGFVFGVNGNTGSTTNGAAAVNGYEVATTGAVFGVNGSTNSTTTNAAGVNGYEGAATGQVYGVNGNTSSTGPYAAAVNGYEGSTRGQVFGVSGSTPSTTNGAAGVSGGANGTTGEVYGVSGYTNSTTTNAAGVWGYASATTGQAFGVAGGTNSTTNGAAAVSGYEGAATGQVYGVSGSTNSISNNAAGVNGYAGATKGQVYGVNGGTNSTAITPLA